MFYTKGDNKLILKYPASWWSNMWRDALPSGNGKIGAAVSGGIHKETIIINHHRLWHSGQTDPLPDVSYTLAKTRDLMDQSKYHEANWILANELKEKGYQSRMAAPLPLGDLNLTMQIEHGFNNYRRILNMETGEVIISWHEHENEYQRKLFVSRADDMIVYHIKADTKSINCHLSFSLRDQDHAYKKEYEKSLTVQAEDQYIYYAVEHENGTDFGAVARVINLDGKIIAEGTKVNVTDASELLVLVKVFAFGERVQCWSQLERDLAAVNRDYDSLLATHRQIHAKLFNSAKISLGSGYTKHSNEELILDAYEGEASLELIEKLWAYGRYLFISSTCADSYPCHMYGLWVGSYRAMWSHFMANENIQMIYWHTLVGGLAHLIPAVFDYYQNLISDFRENAAKLFGCRGIYIPAGTTPKTGNPCQVVPVILNWTGAAGWLAQHFYQYCLYTGDKEFLKEKALPFMREAALFYEDFLQEGEDGYYLIYPSVSPENSPKNYITPEGRALGHPMPTTFNAAMEFAIIKELLSNLIEGSRFAGLFDDQLSKWQAMLEKIPPYQVNQDGAIREWMHPDFEDNYNHRHLSHLYPVFPGQEVTKEQDEELFNAFVKAVKKRLVVGLSAQSGWSLTHMANIYARLGEGDQALECLDLLSRSCLINNFFTLHNDWRNMGICLSNKTAPIQIDANLGWTSAVQEMLFYASPSLIKILPACPGRWTKGAVESFHFCTGKISFIWNRQRKSLHAKLESIRTTDIQVWLPAEYGDYELVGTEGVITKIKDNYWQVQLPAGSILEINAKN